MEDTHQKEKELIRAANAVRKQAYAPYSEYAVGAALLTAEGNIFTGVNVENASYPLSMCAERSALFSAVSAGERKITTIAVVTWNGGSPCGACRQVLSEFGLDIRVLVGNEDEEIIQDITVGELLPLSFGGKDLS